MRMNKAAGFALPTVIVVAIVLMLLGISVVGLSTSQARLSLKRNTGILAREAALAGIQEGLSFIERIPSTSTDVEDIQSVISSYTFVEGKEPSISTSINSGPPTLSYSRTLPETNFTYDMQIFFDNAAGVWSISSLGYYAAENNAKQWPKEIRMTGKLCGSSEGKYAVYFGGSSSGGGGASGTPVTSNLNDSTLSTSVFVSVAPGSNINLADSTNKDGKELEFLIDQDAATPEKGGGLGLLSNPPDNITWKTTPEIFPIKKPKYADVPDIVIIDQNTESIPEEIKAAKVRIYNRNGEDKITAPIIASDIIIEDSTIDGEIKGDFININRCTITNQVYNWNRLDVNETKFTFQPAGGASGGASSNIIRTGDSPVKMKITSWQE